MQEAVKPSPAWERVFTNIGVWGDWSVFTAPITPRSSSSRGGFKSPSAVSAPRGADIVPSGEAPVPDRCGHREAHRTRRGHLPADTVPVFFREGHRRGQGYSRGTSCHRSSRRHKASKKARGVRGGDCQVFTEYCVNRVDFVKALWERVQGRGDYLTVAATNSVPVEY